MNAQDVAAQAVDTVIDSYAESLALAIGNAGTVTRWAMASVILSDNDTLAQGRENVGAVAERVALNHYSASVADTYEHGRSLNLAIAEAISHYAESLALKVATLATVSEEAAHEMVEDFTWTLECEVEHLTRTLHYVRTLAHDMASEYREGLTENVSPDYVLSESRQRGE